MNLSESHMTFNDHIFPIAPLYVVVAFSRFMSFFYTFLTVDELCLLNDGDSHPRLLTRPWPRT